MSFSYKAFDYAIRHHGEQRYGDYSYPSHIFHVAMIVSRFTADTDTIAAACLHDTPEDCNVSIKQLENDFNWRISQIVNLVTDPNGSNRKERKKLLYEKFRQEKEVSIRVPAAIVKCSDRYSNQEFAINTRNFKKIKMYVSEFDEFMVNFGDALEGGAFSLYGLLAEQNNRMQALLLEEALT